jgi:hypothetical protein
MTRPSNGWSMPDSAPDGSPRPLIEREGVAPDYAVFLRKIRRRTGFWRGPVLAGHCGGVLALLLGPLAVDPTCEGAASALRSCSAESKRLALGYESVVLLAMSLLRQGRIRQVETGANSVSRTCRW